MLIIDSQRNHIMKISSLHKRNHELSKTSIQKTILEKTLQHIPTFQSKLSSTASVEFKATALDIFQINLGYMCNMTCAHCHVDAGPDRQEIMQRSTLEYCLEAIRRAGATTIDLTGGAPEMNPNFQWLVEQIRSISSTIEIIVRSNLTILVSNKHYQTYPAFFKKHRLTVIASLPCYTADNTDKQRGDHAFERSIKALKILNQLGYGQVDSGLLLHLVYNPGGAFLPGSQAKLQVDYKKVLFENYQLQFNQLYTITNLPISRFLDYLLEENKLDDYMQLLLDNFNSSAAQGVMCKNTISVSWDGYLYDCDFNQMLEMPVESKVPKHIKDFNLQQLKHRNIETGQHCYGCTAGAGSSCQGAVT